MMERKVQGEDPEWAALRAAVWELVDAIEKSKGGDKPWTRRDDEKRAEDK